MKYDFETVIDRSGTGSFKWNAMKEKKCDVGSHIVPLSVADMEFSNPPQLIEGLKQHLDNTILGYTGATDDYFASVISWMERRHGFSPRREWILQTPGVVPAINMIVRQYTNQGDGVIVFTPVYYPFFSAINDNRRTIVRSRLIRAGLRYDIDFDDFERKAQDKRNVMCIFCSPHNPIGRVWTAKEVERIAKICHDNGVLLVSDEIHNDLIMRGNEHVSVGTLCSELVENSIICTAPSKTFNLAGMQTSNIIIASQRLRQRMHNAQGYFSLSALGYKACQLAYNRCEDWLEELIDVIDQNKRMVEEYMAANIPSIKVYPLEGTYLQWWDMNGLGMDYRQMERFLIEKAELFLDEGSLFGEEGNGFVRINLACPKAVLLDALNRLQNALKTV